MNTNKFNELNFFAEVKKHPNLFFGKPSLISLRDYIFGMEHAFIACGSENQLKYFHSFAQWYYDNSPNKNGYVCWWNHIIYISGGDDTAAFHSFFRIFEKYLKDAHNLSLPEI